MHRTIALSLMACALAACGTTRDGGTVVVEAEARPPDPCPAAATARLEALPADPATGAERTSANAGILSALPETRALAVIKHDQVTLPGQAARWRARLASVQQWCSSRR